MGKAWLGLVGGLAVILTGALLAWLVQTAGGVSVRDVRFAGDRGTTLAALVYMPASATAEHPAPAVLLSHGYINTREMQSAFAIELARRGFVVVAMDQPGHGYSDAIVGANDFGGPAALRYLKSLPQVDKANIGLAGHSLGGGPVVGAAASDPDGYRAAVLVGSTPAIGAVFGSKARADLRNLALVFGGYDEFAELMWQVPRGFEVPRSLPMQALFGVQEPIVPGRVYGDLAAGTARVLHVPPVTHPWEHFSAGGVAPTVDWFQRTLDGEARPRPAGDQIWFWKEVGTLIAFAGMAAVLLAVFEILLSVRWLHRLDRRPQALGPAAPRRDRRWWLFFAVTAALPAATFFPLMKLGMLFLPMPLYPQWITNQLLVWALGGAALTLVIGLATKAPRPEVGADWPRSAAIALLTVAAGYLTLAVVAGVLHVDYRFWVVGLKPLDLRQFGFALAYLPLWTVFFVVALRNLHGRLAVAGEGRWSHYFAGMAAMSLGFAVLLAIQYGALFLTGRLAMAEPLNTIIAIQFVPLMALVGVISVFTWRRTGSHLPGALICALLLAWYVSAGTATHWSPNFQLPMPG